MGLGRMISAFSGGYMNNTNEVYDDLISQLTAGKNKTWREKSSGDFGDVPKICKL
jgi:hypothetical protein